MVLVVALFALSTPSHGQAVSSIYSFNSDNSSQFPNALPAQGRDGRLYGTTTGLSFGSIFVTSTSGAETELFAFGGANGSNPYGALTLGTDGNFYGTATLGGSSGQGVFFKVAPNGAYTGLLQTNNSRTCTPSCYLC